VLLPEVAHIERPFGLDRLGRVASLGNEAPRCGGHPGEDLPHTPRVGVDARQQCRLDEVLHGVGHQHAPGREVGWRLQDQDTPHVQLLGQRRRVHRPASTEGDQREIARVIDAADRDQLESVDHVRVSDPDHAQRRIFD
jgi:hypothetical protein